MGKLSITGGKPVRTKPFSDWPIYSRQEERALQKVLASRNWCGYPFPNTIADRFAQKFAKFHGAKYGLAVSNGMVAIQVALKAAGIGPGDEVIVPAYTWEGTVGPVLLLNAVRAPPRHLHGDPTSLAPHERLTDLAVVPREKPHTGAAAREQPRDSPVIERGGPSSPASGAAVAGRRCLARRRRAPAAMAGHDRQRAGTGRLPALLPAGGQPAGRRGRVLRSAAADARSHRGGDAGALHADRRTQRPLAGDRPLGDRTRDRRVGQARRRIQTDHAVHQALDLDPARRDPRRLGGRQARRGQRQGFATGVRGARSQGDDLPETRTRVRRSLAQERRRFRARTIRFGPQLVPGPETHRRRLPENRPRTHHRPRPPR